jgi:hypothetical protein
MTATRKTFEQYLRDAHDKGVLDHALRARVEANGVVKFYVHPAGQDGDTLDFAVTGDGLAVLPTASTPALAIGSTSVT